MYMCVLYLKVFGGYLPNKEVQFKITRGMFSKTASRGPDTTPVHQWNPIGGPNNGGPSSHCWAQSDSRAGYAFSEETGARSTQRRCVQLLHVVCSRVDVFPADEN